MSEVVDEVVIEPSAPVVEPVVEVVKPKTIDPSDHDRAVSDMLKFKAEAASLKDQLANQEISSLKGKEEWKKIAEIKEREADDAKEQLSGVQKALVSDKKMTAIRDAALSAGIKKEALDDLELFPFEDVVVESTSTGRVNVLNAKDAIDRLKLTKPYLFGSKSANINSSSPEVVLGGKITYNDVLKAEKQAKSSGDYALYTKTLLQFKNQ